MQRGLADKRISWFIFGLMASVTFVGILSELVPSGILPEMAAGLAIKDSQVGFLVGFYALASAICAIPLISLTLAMNRKTLLLLLLTGFAVSNIVVGLSSSYNLIIAMRIVGNICAGIMWPMIAGVWNGTRSSVHAWQSHHHHYVRQHFWGKSRLTLHDLYWYACRLAY